MNAILHIALWLRLLALFVVGSCAGSLANLAIYRLGWNRRWISPWSRPPADAPPRRLFDRLPVLGWLGLRREAGLHGRGFWIRPMLLELLAGAAFAALYWWETVAAGLLGPEVPRPLDPDLLPVLHHQYVAHAILFWLMWVATWIDIDEKTIPDAVTVPGTLAALALMAVWPSSLLPGARTDAHGVPWVYFVMLTSPNDNLPWLKGAWSGLWALGLGLGCYGLWCIALVPRSWYPRHGYRRALQLCFARLVRERSTYAILAMGLVGAAIIAGVWAWSAVHPSNRPNAWAGLLSALAGLAVGGGTIWIVRVLGSLVLRREAMGFGDVTLMAMIGAMLGWQAAVIVFFLAPLAGAVVGLAQWAIRGESEIPYGPFLCLAAVVTIAAWAPIWEWGAGSANRPGLFTLGWWLLAILLVCLAMLVVLLPLVRWVLSLFRGARG
jgi:prepilin signal peptidase PulO-like enzyme (type II secretory pathway)